MSKPVSKFWEWFSSASVAQRKRLATLCRSSVASLRFGAKGFRSDGVPNLTADFASRIEEGIAIINQESEGSLPDVRREDLSDTCRKCPYQQACNGVE